MGSKIYLPDTFSASTGKKLKNDTILPLSGALLLLDGGHSGGGLGTFPTSGALLPNVALAEAQALTGGGTAVTLGASFTQNAGGVAQLGREKTPKGGLHVAARQDVQTANGGAFINLGTGIDSWLLANTPHAYFVSMWEEVTRVGAVNPSPGIASLAICTAPGAALQNFLVLQDQNGWRGQQYAPNSQALGFRNPNPNAMGKQIRNAGVTAMTGSYGGSVADAVVMWGSIGTWNSFVAANPASASSRIFYRLYIEDLTVSGRSYAEVDALDYALWQKEFAVGGRFYGDTWTAPATLAGA